MLQPKKYCRIRKPREREHPPQRLPSRPRVTPVWTIPADPADRKMWLRTVRPVERAVVSAFRSSQMGIKGLPPVYIVSHYGSGIFLHCAQIQKGICLMTKLPDAALSNGGQCSPIQSSTPSPATKPFICQSAPHMFLWAHVQKKNSEKNYMRQVLSIVSSPLPYILIAKSRD
jgi:hypothetical protein